MSAAKALGIDEILDEIVWYLHAGSCAVEQCRGANLEFSSILLKDDKCLRNHRKSLGRILTVSKKWFSTSIPHLWGFYIDAPALSRFVSSTSRAQANTGWNRSTKKSHIRHSLKDRWRFYAKYIKRLEVTNVRHFREHSGSAFFPEVLSVFGGGVILPSLRVLQFELLSGQSEFPSFAAILPASVRKIQLLVQTTMDHEDIENYLGIIAERSQNLVSLAVCPHPQYYSHRQGNSNNDKSPLDQPSNHLLASLARLSHLQSLTIPSCWTTATSVLNEMKNLPSLRSLDLQDLQSSCNLLTSITSPFNHSASFTPSASFPSLSSILLRGNISRLGHLLRNTFAGCTTVHHLSLLVERETTAEALDTTDSDSSSRELATFIAGAFPQLQVLSLEWRYSWLSGADIRTFSSCTSLTVIELVGIEFASEDELGFILDAWPNIRALTLVSGPAAAICLNNEDGLEDPDIEPQYSLTRIDLPGLSMGCLSLLAGRLPRLERLVTSVTVEPAHPHLWPSGSLTYLELRSSFLAFWDDSFSNISAAKYLSSLLRSHAEFVFTVDPSLKTLASENRLWESYVTDYTGYFEGFQEKVVEYLEVRSDEEARIAQRIHVLKGLGGGCDV